MSVQVGYGIGELLFLFVKIWALILWARYPGWAWDEGGHTRSLWLVLLIVSFFLPCFGFLIAMWFIFSVSVDVSRVTKLGGRPGFPGS